MACVLCKDRGCRGAQGGQTRGLGNQDGCVCKCGNWALNWFERCWVMVVLGPGKKKSQMLVCYGKGLG